MQIDTVDLGFIFNAKKQQQVFQLMIGYYKNLSIKSKNKFVLFALDNLDVNEQIINGTIIEEGCIRHGFCKIPPHIYNFALHSTPDKIDKMRQLRKMENIIIVNPINRFVQGIIFEMITSLTGSQKFLLPSVSFNAKNLIECLNKYETLFLLPENTFHPPKALLIKKMQNSDYMIYIGQNGQLCKKDDIVHYIKKMINKKKYIIFKGIDCFKIGNGPMEARIYLQKDITGDWSVTSVPVKQSIFARHEFFYSNICDIPPDPYYKVIRENEKSLMDISLQIGRFLDYYIPHVGSFTFDFIFDVTGCPYLIYVSGFEQDSFFYHHTNSETRTALLKKAFQYLCYFKNNDSMEKGAHYEMD